MASLLDLAQARLQGLLDIPTRAARALVNPTAFSGLLGAPTLPQQQGFAESFAQLPQQPNMSVLDPMQASYMQGYSAGEPYGLLAALAPFTKGMPVGASIKDVSKTLPNDYNQLSIMATEAYSALKKNPSKETHDLYKMVMEARDNATLNNPRNVVEKPTVQTDETYRGQHQAPMADSGKPLFDLTDVYPEDFYSSKAVQYYGTGDPSDFKVINQLQYLRNKPNESVWMYRAVPKDAPSEISKGDWVTIDRNYAKEHGESALGGEYKIVKRKAYARDLYTNGDSPYEMGYDPQPRISTSKKTEGLLD